MDIGRITPPRLRTQEQEAERTATWLELFYDLAFVVAVAVLSARLLGDITLVGVASFFAYFALLWWLWASHTYYADRYDTDDLIYRVLAAAQMATIVVVAAALSGETQSTAAFATGYALARILLVIMYTRAYRHVPKTRDLVRGYLIGFGIAAAVWTAAIFVPESLRFALWVVALTIDLATPWVMRKEQAKVPLDVSHLPERFGLFTILVLGESIAAVVAAVTHSGWAPASVLALIASIGIATTFWWLYFDNARGGIVRRDASVRRTWRPTGWIYTHLPLAAALAALAVAMERATDESVGGTLHVADRWLLLGSASLALASLAMVQFASSTGPEDLQSRGIVINRFLGVVVLVAFGFLTDVRPVWMLVAVLGVGIAELIGDMAVSGSPEAEFESERMK
ncbi:MAG: low temperature requirement protein A [Actinomycetota bacterium]